MQPLAAQVEAAGHELPVPAQEGLHVLERAHLVVAPGEHLEQGLRARGAGDHPRPEQAYDGLGQPHHRVDVLGRLVTVGVLVEVTEVVAGVLVGLLARLPDERLLEQPVADAAAQVAQARVAQLGGDDEPVDHLADLVTLLFGHVAALLEPSLEEGPDDRDVVGSPLLGEEDPVDGLLQPCTGLEVHHAVVADGTGQPDLERVGQLLLLDVERLEVGVEVLARAVHLLLGRLLLVGRPVAREVADVGEGG